MALLMKILAFDRKNGVMKLKVESEDDLWHLSNIITAGSKLTMHTTRKLKKEFEGGKRVEQSRVHITLSIEVKKTEYHSYLNVLRASGPIVAGPEEISHGEFHTMGIAPGSSLVLEKRFGPLDLKRLDESKERQPRLLIVLMDRDEALFSLVGASGIEHPLTVHSHLPPKGKGYESAMEEFFSEIAEKLLEVKDRVDGIVVAGPGWVKDSFADHVKEKNLGLKFTLESASSATKSALKEVLDRYKGRELCVARDTKTVNELFSAIAKNSAAYGIGEVKTAVEYGAASTLIVSDELIRKMQREGTFGELEDTIRMAEERGAAIMIIGSGHEAGDRLMGLGGIAAFLRFRLPQTQ